MSSFNLYKRMLSSPKTAISLCTVLCLTLCLSGLTACDVIVPPTRPPESQILAQDNYAFDNIDLLDYSFIGITRIDCPLINSALTGSGICAPHNTVVGQLVHCSLAYPYEDLEFGCIDSGEVPSVYFKMTASKDAQNQAFPKEFGACKPAQAGPAAGEQPRYTTDPGYKVCLFEGSPKISAGILSSNDNDARPVGLYLDLAKTEQDIDAMTQQNAFSGPYTLMLDARYLEPEDKERAFKTVFELFNVYRHSAAENQP